jgi:hypothetical protein
VAEATAKRQDRTIFFAPLPESGDVGVRDGAFDLVIVPDLSLADDARALLALVRRVLSPAAVPWAVFLAACSDQVLWHTCEAKPYAVDVLVAVDVRVAVRVAVLVAVGVGVSVTVGVSVAVGVGVQTPLEPRCEPSSLPTY